MNRTTSLIVLFTIICFVTASFAGNDGPNAPPPKSNRHRNIIIIEDDADALLGVEHLLAHAPQEAQAAPTPQGAPLIRIDYGLNRLPYDDADFPRFQVIEFPPLDAHTRVMIACVFLVAAMKVLAH